MFRKIRRVKNEISLEDAKLLLKNNKRAILSVNGLNGYPHSFPINYFYNAEENKLYFHGAKMGYKIDCINKDNRATFVTYGNEVLTEDGWSYKVSSAIAYGKIELIEDREETLKFVKELAMKYYTSEKEVDEVIKRSGSAVLVYRLNIEHLTGKIVHEK